VKKALNGQIKELKKTISLMHRDGKKVRDTLPCHIKELKDAYVQTVGMDQLEEQNRKLEEELNIHLVQNRDWKNVEKALRGQINELKWTISLMHHDREKLRDTFPHHIKEQDTRLQTDGLDQEETILNSQVEEQNRKLEEELKILRVQKRDWKNVENALCGQIKELKKTVSLMHCDREKVRDTLPCHKRNMRTRLRK